MIRQGDRFACRIGPKQAKFGKHFLSQSGSPTRKIAVGRILPPGLFHQGQIIQNRLTIDRQQRADQPPIRMAGHLLTPAHPAQPGHRRAANQTHQQRLKLVIPVMRRHDGLNARLTGQIGQCLISRPTRRRLQIARGPERLTIQIGPKKRQPQSTAALPDQFRIGFRLPGWAKMMLHVGNRQPKMPAPLWRQLGHRAKQRHGIRSAADRQQQAVALLDPAAGLHGRSHLIDQRMLPGDDDSSGDHLPMIPLPFPFQFPWMLLTLSWPMDPMSATLLVIGLAVIMLAIVSQIKKRRADILDDRRPLPGSPERRLTPDERIERDRQLRGLETDLRSLTAEVEQMAQRLSRRLDQQSQRLEQLIQQADQRIAQLQAISPAASSAAPMPPLASALRPQAGSPAADPLSQSIYALADQGLSSQEIACRLHEHTGKVELILALRNV